MEKKKRNMYFVIKEYCVFGKRACVKNVCLFFCFITGIKQHFAQEPVVQLKSRVVLNETMAK